ncbi:MAG: hypothetical protein WC872_02260 [Candidatus Absconditabacterales bacterium]
MKEKTKYILSIALFVIIVLGLTIFIIIFSKPNQNSNPVNTLNGGINNVEKQINESNSTIENNQNTLFLPNTGTCEFSGLGDFEYIDIYSGEVNNPEHNYTKNI